jgi:predicted DNA-binding antitoxin AbrB/MazE fold protein
MQACKAYYNNGLFVPVGFGKLPEGTQAIITILDEVPIEKTKKLTAFDKLCNDVQAAINEEMPPIIPLRLKEFEL